MSGYSRFMGIGLLIGGITLLTWSQPAMVAAVELQSSNLLMHVTNFDSTPPAGTADSTVSSYSASAKILSEVPTSTWTYGCSATSAGMIFGYYDRIGYSNMYTGSYNGGVAPLTDLGANTSLIATKLNFDGRTTRGHVDDYWSGYGDKGPDPWQTNLWTEHVWGDCTADYMGTNQWKWDFDPEDGVIDSNMDGATTYFAWESGEKLYDYVPPAEDGLPQTELCHGMRLFAESRGYTVLENYTQNIDALYSDGFSFADYINEIDNGYPVMIQVDGHSMVGVGYDTAGSLVYLHDTWDNEVHSMTWGGEYSGMDQMAVTVIHLQAVPEPSTAALLVLGASFAAGYFRRRRRS